jgi:signal transduction histidine kinase
VARETVDAILEAQETKRSRIARELHDETGSALSAVLLGLTAIDQAATLLEARHASTALREPARTTLQNVARMAFELRPATLDEFGLGPRAQRLGGAVWRADRRSSSIWTLRPLGDCPPKSRPRSSG